jgi:predicted nucleic acid-binding protein
MHSNLFVTLPLYTRVFLPPAVVTELQDLEAPEEVRAWVAGLPAWCEVQRPAALREAETLAHLGAGEWEAILLAQEMRADFLLIDEEDGRQAARSRALTVTGTLGVLERAAERGLLDLPSPLARLLTTSFRVRDELIQGMLARDAARKRTSGRIQTENYGFKVFAVPSALLNEFSGHFTVQLDQLCHSGSLFHGYTTCCRTRCYV